MKTQITEIKKGNHFQGIVGTPYATRFEISKKVVAENPEQMTIDYCGYKIDLKISYSESGKSFAYYSKPLPTEVVELVAPYDKKGITDPDNVHYVFAINEDMTCAIHTSRRRHENAQWKVGQTIVVNNEDVTII